MTVLLEVAVDNPADGRAALEGGAERVELCAHLETGGLTPPAEWVKALDRDFPGQIAAMVRAKPGPFTADERDQAEMERQIDSLIVAGARAVVFGVLDAAGEIDRRANARLWNRCTGARAVFHRAFDSLPDPLAALGILEDLGFERVLTSGGRAPAADPASIKVLAALTAAAGRRLTILPGGGVRASNVRRVVEGCRCSQVHSSCRDSTGRFSSTELTALLAELARITPSA